MKKTALNCLLLAVAHLLYLANPLSAAIIGIDLDADSAGGMPGIQPTRTVTIGVPFTIDVVYVGDGVAAFDAVFVDLQFNDAGPLLGPTSPAMSGGLVGTAPTVSDAVTPFPVLGGPGLALGAGTLTPLAAFGANTGGSGMFSGTVGSPGPPFGGTFPMPPLGTASVDIYSMTFVAGALGTSHILPVGSAPPMPLSPPFGPTPIMVTDPGSVLLLGGTPLMGVTLTSGVVTVTPEPGSLTLALVASGLAGLFGCRRVRRRRARAVSDHEG